MTSSPPPSSAIGSPLIKSDLRFLAQQRLEEKRDKNRLCPHIDVFPDQFRFLAENGYQVIKGVVDTKTCDQVLAKMKQWFVDIGTGVTLDDASTWTTQRLPTSVRNGIVQQYGGGQEQFVWDIRQDPRVTNVFAQLWNTEPRKLITSFDGFCLRPPPEALGKEGLDPHDKQAVAKSNWYHCDQGEKKLKWTSIQSFVALEDMNRDDATLMVLQKSHLNHVKFFQQFPGSHKDDWVKYTPEQLAWHFNQPHVVEVRVEAKKGDMVMWDSRTVHCAGESLKNRQNPDRWRALVYVCDMPRVYASDAELRKKRELFRDKRVTNHYPYPPKVFAKEPNPLWGGKNSSQFKLSNKLPVLTPLGQCLAGY